MGRVRLVMTVSARPRVRAVVAAYGVFAVVENAVWLGITVYAFQRGGVTEAGVVAAVQLLPAAVVAPFAAAAGDRFRIDRVLLVGYAVQAAAIAATAIAIAAAAPALLVYAASTIVSVAVTFTRPAMGTLLPSISSSAADLTAANVALGVLTQIGSFVGPACAGLLLVSGPGLVFAVMAVAAAAAAGLVSRVRLLSVPTVVSGIGPGDVLRETAGGFRALGEERDLRLLVLVASIAPLLLGVSDVLFAAIGETAFDDPAAGAGLLGAAFGIGAVAGACSSAALIGRSRLSGPLAASLLVGALAVILLAGPGSIAIVLVAFVLCGGGCSVADVAAATMVPRLAPPRRLSRVCGVIESLQMFGIAVGSLLVSALVAWWGLSTALVAIGLAILTAVVVTWPLLRRLDHVTEQSDPQFVRFMASAEAFAGLGAPQITRLAAVTAVADVADGVDVVRQGDVGDRYYLVGDGSLTVTVDGRPVRELGRGSAFGEVALVRDIRRTATVTARTPARLYTIGREDFLTAVAGHPRARRAADAAAQHWLDEDTSRRTTGGGT